MTGKEAVIATVKALDECGIDYMVVGSFSSNLYGVERSTRDADFVVQFEEGSIGKLSSKLLPEIKIDPQPSFETVTMTTRLIATVVGSPFKIEFFFLSNDPHDQERFRRRHIREYDGQRVCFPTAEDVLITKALWVLRSNRSKDRDDVRDVIFTQADRLDWDYIHLWADRHGTRALLDEIRHSIPPID